MFENDIELKRLASEDFSSYKGILSLGSSEDILTPSDIAGYRVDSNEDYNNLLSSYEEEGSGIFGLRRIVDGEIVGILAARQRNDEASIGVFVGKPYRNFQYATTSIEEALSALDAEKVKSAAIKKGEKLKAKATELVEYAKEKGEPVLIENSNTSSLSKPFFVKLIIFDDLSSMLNIGTFLFLIANIRGNNGTTS